MRKFLSYFFPITEKIKTDKNGIVELTLYNGRKMLNSKNANYSYDSLQRILKYGLKQIDLTTVNSVLLLGLGGGSVIKTLRNDFKFNEKITAVDIDKTIIEIAANEFDVLPESNLEIVQADAFEYVESTSLTFDLVIVDLFIDTEVPEMFYGVDFWNNIKKILNDKGTFLFNAAVNREENNPIEKLMSLFSHWSLVTCFDKVNRTNSLIIGTKI